MKNPFIHETADVDKDATIGTETKIWHYAQIREHAKIGSNCTISKNVYIDFETIIGDNCKIQNNASIYHKTILEFGVFIGPHVIITNDKNPRAITPDGTIRPETDWAPGTVLVKYGASIGAGSIILPNVTIGKFAMIGAGSVVTEDVPDFALVYGNPAKIHGRVDEKGTVTERFDHV
jgi:acetyltransferase-like isoleucine patch superfamily enzyme